MGTTRAEKITHLRFIFLGNYGVQLSYLNSSWNELEFRKSFGNLKTFTEGNSYLPQFFWNPFALKTFSEGKCFTYLNYFWNPFAVT